MAFTFTTLKTAIQDYTDNTESTFVSQLSRFILNAEERILKECQLDDFRKNVTGSSTQSSKFLTKPTYFLSPFSLSVFNSSANHIGAIFSGSLIPAQASTVVNGLRFVPSSGNIATGNIKLYGIN